MVCVLIHARNALRTCNPAYFEESAPSGDFFSNSDPNFYKFGLISPLILLFNSLNFEMKKGTFLYKIDFDPRDDV